jgi:hypothetical protein
MRINKKQLDAKFNELYFELISITKKMILKYNNKNEAENIISETYIYLLENLEKIEKIENIKIFALKFIKGSIVWKNSKLNIKGESGKGCKNGTIKKIISFQELESVDSDKNKGIENFLNSVLINGFNRDLEELESKIIENKKEINLRVLKEHYRHIQKDPVMKTIFKYYVDEKQNTVRKIAETFNISKRMANISINNLLDDMKNFAELNGYYDFLK